MPHLVLEHSHGLSPASVAATCQALFAAACTNPIFTNTAAIKVRSVACHNVHMGTTPETFAHLTIRLLSGRDTDQKKVLAEAFVAVMDTHLPDVGSLSADLQDMNPETYSKRVI